MGDGRFYWLKLKRDFFKRHDIRIVEKMPNGKDYLLFYLKLLCESVDHEGSLRFSESIPYNAEMLATITDTNVDVVRSAVKTFCELGMMDILDDGTIFMNEVSRMIGSAADNGNANRQRKFREKQKQLMLQDCYESVTKSNESKSTETEKETEIEKEEKRPSPRGIIELFNDMCPSLPKVRSYSEARTRVLKARLKQYKLEDFKALFLKAEHSDFLKGKNNRGWQANFDWLVKDSNMAKVLDGNYDNRMENQYSMIAEWAGEENGN